MVSVVGVISGLDAYVKDKIIRMAPDVSWWTGSG